jgi:2-oxoglutarate ferredoxin oxidoreductase subunit gamma
MRKEIRIAGFGGQGVILAGIIVGKAASIFDGINAVQTQSYGPEARGGASKTEVVISYEDIQYPKIVSPDILVAMSHEALTTYIHDLKEGGTLIIDPDFVHEEDVEDFLKKHKIKVYYARVTKTAEFDIGLKIVANIVMVGAITKITKIISREAAEKAILDSVPPGTEKKNIQAFEAGYAMDGT